MLYLTADFGSTYTKLTLIDSNKADVLGTASSFTTIDTDVMVGFDNAMAKLKEKVGEFTYDDFLCCSSAAGGLKMVALGLVPDLTAKAARMAASSAGAKVVKTYSYEISKAEQEEIGRISPDIVLLCGGTDGGNKEVIIANARRLVDINGSFSIIAAGNKIASYELDDIFSKSGKNYKITENVMPSFGKVNVEPARTAIREVFIKNIISAKGLSKVQAMSKHEIIPTPLAVLKGCELFSAGTNHEEGIGDFMAFDVGGATTDVYSMSKGEPSLDNVLLKGLPEPFAKRTVEGDLGMRYSMDSLFESVDIEKFCMDAGISENDLQEWRRLCKEDMERIPQTDLQKTIEEAIARMAIKLAAHRHAGVMDKVYTPMGEIFSLEGKDLAKVPYIIGIGGSVINSRKPDYVLSGGKYDINVYNSMLPKEPKYMLDSRYIFSSMGLLSLIDKETALKIMKKEISKI